MSIAYVDASALTKLAIDEPESMAMRQWYLEHDHIVSSRIGLIETRRAVGRGPHDPLHLETIMASTVSIELDEAIARQAASVGPPSLRTLDAIHLATAMALGGELDAFVTYDDRLAAAARAVGLPVVRPA